MKRIIKKALRKKENFQFVYRKGKGTISAMRLRARAKRNETLHKYNNIIISTTKTTACISMNGR